MNVELCQKDFGKSHPVREMRKGKISIMFRILSNCESQLMFVSKRKLKGDIDKIFISENLTKLSERLNSLKQNGKVD